MGIVLGEGRVPGGRARRGRTREGISGVTGPDRHRSVDEVRQRQRVLCGAAMMEDGIETKVVSGIPETPALPVGK